MREQSARPWKAGDTQAPIIKVTTIKMMAQILEGNVYLDATSSCDILISLLEEARHIDARVTITSSLFSILENPTCTPELRKRILAAFKASFVPVAARLNERRPLTEADWEVVADVGEEAPLLTMFAARARSRKLPLDDRTELAQFIMEALEKSAANNERWMRVFLAKYNLGMDTISVGPVDPTVLATIFEHFRDTMPLSLFDMMKDAVLVNLDPTPEVTRVTGLVKANPELVASNAGKHWLRHFDNPGLQAFPLGLQQVVSTLNIPGVAPFHGEITDARLQKLTLAAAGRMVRRGNVQVLDQLVGQLCQHRLDSHSSWETWMKKCVPIVMDIVSMIEATRSALDRPSTLPNTFSLQAKVLPIPYSSDRVPASAKDLDVFVEELSALISQLARRRLPYHTDFVKLRAELGSIRSQDLAAVAVGLAQIEDVVDEDQPSLADYLRLELVADFIQRATDLKDPEVRRKLQALLSVWQNCKAEGLRTMGQQTGKSVADKLAKAETSK